MEVYVEQVIFDNFVIDYLLMRMAAKTARGTVTFFRLSLSALIGVALALVIPLLKINAILAVAIKISVAIIMTVCALKKPTFPLFALTFAFFLIYTFVLGGAIIGVSNLIGFEWQTTEDFGLATRLPTGVVVLSAYILCQTVGVVFEKIYRKKAVIPYICKCAVVINGKETEAFGLIDSGNRVIDSRTGKPVILCSRRLAAKIFSDNLFGKTKARIMEIATVSGESKIILTETELIKIYFGNEPNIINNVIIGISSKASFSHEYDLIIPPSLRGKITQIRQK